MKITHKILLTIAVLCIDNSYALNLKKRDKKIPSKKRSTTAPNNPLFHAARTNNIQQMNDCIAKKEDLNMQDDNGQTAAMIAAQHGNLAVLKLLIQQKASMRIKDNNQKTALDFAKEGGWKTCFDFLVKRTGIRRYAWHVLTKSTYNFFSSDSELGLDFASRRDPKQSLFDALNKNDFDKAKKLLIFGVDINARDKNRETPLHKAVRSENLAVVKFLVERGAWRNPSSNKQETPLYIALRSNYKPCIEYLISFGANINRRDAEGNTFLHKVVEEQDSAELVERLIEYKADVEAKNNKAETPLWCALKRSRMNVAAILLKAGASINTQNLKGETLLHDACNRDDYLLAEKLLMDKDIDLNIKDNTQQTVLDIALQSGHKNILELLLRYADKINIQNLLVLDNNKIANKLAKKLMKEKSGECIICFEEGIQYLIPCAHIHPNDLICYNCIVQVQKSNNCCPTCREPLHKTLFNELCKSHIQQKDGFNQIELEKNSLEQSEEAKQLSIVEFHDHNKMDNLLLDVVKP